jgi:RimJ/RimL family protein N-acetyltransferase
MAVVFPDEPRAQAHAARSSTAQRSAGLERLSDGTIVALRWIGPEDASRIRSGFEHLSPTSRYRRFFTPMPRLSEGMLQRLVATDGWNHLAIGAETVPVFGGRRDAAGIARFHRLAERPRAAEVAITVVDAFQRRGLGRILLRELARAARERDIDVLIANVLPDNEPMLRLIHRLDPAATSMLRDGTWTFEVALGATPGGLPSRRSEPRRAA